MRRRTERCILMGVAAALAVWGAQAWLAPAGAAPKGGGEKKAEKKADKAEKKAEKKPAAAAPAKPAAPSPKPAPAFSPEAVDDAIERAVKYLWSKRDGNGTWGEHGEGHKYHVGPTALVAYAMMEAGVNPQEARMAKTLEWLGQQKTEKTYELACRANAALAANRTTSDKHRPMLEKDAELLIRGGTQGRYNYDCTLTPQHRWDNSNCQFGVLGVWAAVQNNGEVPTQYWQQVMRHWETCQNPDGGWGYRDEGKGDASRATMTVGGVATLFVCFDQVFAGNFINCQQKFSYQPILKGLAWIEEHFPKSVGGGKPNFYYLYGVERAALASGYKYFGKSDWYKIGATALLRSQDGNGGWDSVVNTAFSILFLVRGRNPVVFNKLQYEGDWNNRPRDLASLTTWMSRTFERTVNWQIINLNVPVHEWHDAPILTIAGSIVPKFTDEDIKKLRSFALQGGCLLTLTECGGTGFQKGMRDAYEKIFPEYPLKPLPADHELYTRKVYYDVPGGRPPLHMVSNGVRPLAIHCDADLPISWQLRKTASQLDHYKLAANIVRYVGESITYLRPRGSTHWVGQSSFTPARTVAVARVKHPGNWNPEPLAFERFERMMGGQTRTKIEYKTVSPADLPKSGCKVAMLTGTGDPKLTAGDQKALKQFVDAGGTLIIDAAGGANEFASAAEAAVKGAFGEREPRLLAGTSVPYKLAGHDIQNIRYRVQTRSRLNTKSGNLRGVLAGDRVAVLFSPEDLTVGLLGVHSFNVDGYAPETAYEIVRNMVLSTR